MDDECSVWPRSGGKAGELDFRMWYDYYMGDIRVRDNSLEKISFKQTSSYYSYFLKDAKRMFFSSVPIWKKPTWVVWEPTMSQPWKRCLSAVKNLRLSICGTRKWIISWKMWRKRRRCSMAAQAWISWPSRRRSKQKNLSQCFPCSKAAHHWLLLICQVGIWIMW